jgi:hypothetical protein
MRWTAGLVGTRDLRCQAEPVFQRLTERAGRVVLVAESLRDEYAARQIQVRDDGAEPFLVAGLGDQELHVGVRDVALQVLVAPCVVQAHQHRSDKAGTTEREHIIRGVVQEYPDVGRSTRIEPGTIERSEPLGFDQKLSVGPDLVAESERRSVARTRVEGVPTQKLADIASGQRYLAQGRGECDTFGHFSRFLPASTPVPR